MIRNTSIAVLLIAVLVAMTPALAEAQLNVADPGVKELEFTGDFIFLSEAPVETIEGTLSGAKGRIITNTEDLTQTSGTISVPVEGMKTGNKTRDKHVVGKLWLEAKKYPEITFEIQSVKVGTIDDAAEVKVAELDATGLFSLHGQTKEMTIPLTLKWKGDRVKVSAQFELALADYAVKGKKGVVGERVGASIELTANLTGTVQ